jgi:shikimate kinase
MSELRIFLTGFMTSGKSTIGPILANVMGLEFYDLDSVIEVAEEMTVVEIFEKKGESYFRKVESRMLEKLSAKSNVLISLGGGTMADENNFNLMKSAGKTIYLKVEPEMLYKRLKNKIDRPLFRDLVLNESPEEDFVKRISEFLDKRKAFYEKADIIISTDHSPIGITVDKIAKKIRELTHEKN